MLKVSIVTPTYYRHLELPDYLKCIENQTYKPYEIILVDGADPGENRTETLVQSVISSFPNPMNYYRRQGGTAIQRNFGIDFASGDILLFVDDDVRLNPNFIAEICTHFEKDLDKRIGGITGFRKDRYLNMSTNNRWIWYRRLRLLTIFEPGKYDYKTGYPINNNAQAEFNGVREVDFMTTACTAYRGEVFQNNFRFDPFFVGYGILEDAHLSLRIKQKGFNLLQCGDATCVELKSKTGRTDMKIIGERTVTNYYYVFKTICGNLTLTQKMRFFRFQAFELFRAASDIIRFRNNKAIRFFQGKVYGIYKVMNTGLKLEVSNYYKIVKL